MFKKILKKLTGRTYTLPTKVTSSASLVKPDTHHPEAVLHTHKGDGYLARRKYSQAVAAYQSALAKDPSMVDIYIKLAGVLQEIKKIDEAINAYQTAIVLNPKNYYPYFALAGILQSHHNLEGALLLYQTAAKYNPDNTEILNNIACVLLRQRDKHLEAEAILQHIIALNPKLVEAYINLGTVYIQQGKFQAACQILEQVESLSLANVQIYSNLAIALYCQNKLDAADTMLLRAIKQQPHFLEAHWHRALVLLKQGNYREGFKKYEHRLKQKVYLNSPLGQRYRKYRKWQYGENIAGKTIMLHYEQGFGDTLQFIRYAPEIAKRGATVLLECQSELVGLLQNVKSIKQVIAAGEPLPRFDRYAPLLSLPMLCDTALENLPVTVPYISVDSVLMQRWSEKIVKNNMLKVGLVWAGNARREQKEMDSYYIDKCRSLRLEQFIPLMEIAGIEWYSLQKGEEAAQIKTFTKNKCLIDYTEEMLSFADTAALIMQLDLVISVDTAVAHLAGALGKPVWVLSRFDSCWRWLLEREDSPWYPSLRLFRQEKLGDWDAVIARVVEALLVRGAQCRIFTSPLVGEVDAQSAAGEGYS